MVCALGITINSRLPSAFSILIARLGPEPRHRHHDKLAPAAPECPILLLDVLLENKGGIVPPEAEVVTNGGPHALHFDGLERRVIEIAAILNVGVLKVYRGGDHPGLDHLNARQWSATALHGRSALPSRSNASRLLIVCSARP